MANYDRELTIEAIIDHAKGHISKHKVNVEILMQRPSGIGEHGDVLTEIEKELKVIAEYDDQLEVLNKYFIQKDPFKSE
tara:strand:+ start:157 stop:393 length:237 start_codon:yes stop_codon:yes gene_type:complete